MTFDPKSCTPYVAPESVVLLTKFDLILDGLSTIHLYIGQAMSLKIFVKLIASPIYSLCSLYSLKSWLGNDDIIKKNPRIHICQVNLPDTPMSFNALPFHLLTSPTSIARRILDTLDNSTACSCSL